MSKKWKSGDYLQHILDELMRRRYFRKSIEKLLHSAGVSTVNEISGHNIILQLLKVEDKLLSSKILKTIYTDSSRKSHGKEIISKDIETKKFPYEQKHTTDTHTKTDFSGNDNGNFSNHDHETNNKLYDDEHEFDRNKNGFDSNFSDNHEFNNNVSSNQWEYQNNFTNHDQEIDKNISNREQDFHSNFQSQEDSFESAISSHEQ